MYCMYHTACCILRLSTQHALGTLMHVVSAPVRVCLCLCLCVCFCHQVAALPPQAPSGPLQTADAPRQPAPPQPRVQPARVQPRALPAPPEQRATPPPQADQGTGDKAEQPTGGEPQKQPKAKKGPSKKTLQNFAVKYLEKAPKTGQTKMDLAHVAETLERQQLHMHVLTYIYIYIERERCFPGAG